MDGRPPNDEALMAQLQQRDAAALEALYDRYADVAFGMVARMLDREVAQDIVQESFIALWQKPDRFQPERGRFSSWFLTLVHRRALDELRRRKRLSQVQYHASERIEALLHAEVDVVEDPALSVDTEAQQRAVKAGLRTLPAEQRKVLLMAYFDGLTHVQIAEKLRLPLGTVKTRARLGLNKLKGALEGSVG